MRVGIKVISFQRGERAAKINRLYQSRLACRLAAAGFVTATAFSPLISIAAGAANADSGSFAKGRILVLPRPGLPQAELAKIVSVHGGRATKITSYGLHVVELPPNASERAVAALLAHHPQLKFAEVDHRLEASYTPNDPYFGSEWHAAKIGAPAAWDSTRGAGVTIAVLDTGVDEQRRTGPQLAFRHQGDGDR